MAIQICTTAQARDDVSGMLETGLQAAVVATTIATMPTIVWDDSAQTVLPSDVGSRGSPNPLPPTWIRFRIKHVTGSQISLTGAGGTARYNRKGLLIAYIYSTGTDGQNLSDTMADVILSIYEGKQSTHSVWFRDGSIAEIGTSGPWWQINAKIAFEYDQIK